MVRLLNQIGKLLLNHNSMEQQSCLLCKQRPATKTNSHIIPSFMIAKVCSYDGRGKRDQEVMFTMSSYEDKVYTGQIPSTKLEELFDIDKLSDERIENELKDNTASKDYIFCPDCEKDLATYLESPYAEYLRRGKKIDFSIAYYFWLSVVWRMSISEKFNFRLPIALEEHLGENLHDYLEAVKQGKSIDDIISSCVFRYRIVASPDSLNDEKKAGFFGGRFDLKRDIISLSMGDKILCVTFNDDPLPGDYSFISFENELKTAVINNGQSVEQETIVDKERFADGIRQMVKEKAFKRLLHEKERADTYWKKAGQDGEMPIDIFKELIERLYSEDTKQGDRKTLERYNQLFKEVLQSFGIKLRG